MTTHAGTHHFAKCGEWRPTPGNHDCTACPTKCPSCGAYRVELAGSDRGITAADSHAVVSEIRDRISKGEA